MRILVLGASGMLGHVLAAELTRYGFEVHGTLRTPRDLPGVPADRLHAGIHVEDPAGIEALLDRLRPGAVVNAIGLIRQLPAAREPLPCIEINARFPHLLAAACARRGVRFIHYSTDCVFDGHKGSPYVESDPATAGDLYGLTKYLGEVQAPSLTLRTSIIGPELQTRWGLLEWFLTQEGAVRGYTKAIYTGLTTVEQARVLARYVLPKPELAGLYQVVSAPISKYDLLRLIARFYGKTLRIDPDDRVNEDKRMSGAAFAAAVGYQAPEWPELIEALHAFGRGRGIQDGRATDGGGTL